MTRFWKLHGLGNDFVFLEPGAHPTKDFIIQICDRLSGVGSDGLIVVEPSRASEAVMRMWNPDGSESGMCGNGLRCAALFLNREFGFSQQWQIQLGGGRYSVGGSGPFTVDMGEASLLWADRMIAVGDRELAASAVDMGNPHIIFFVDEPLEPLLAFGSELENHPDFPHRTNVHFARRQGTEVTMVTWERGAGATLACGSGACAVAVAANQEGKHLVHLPGGDLCIETASGQVTMMGPAQFVFQGVWRP